MDRYLLRRIIWTICFAIVSYSFPVTDQDDAALYFKNFGYIEESTGGIIAQETVSTAIKDFQNFAGLSETGELDDETIAKMNMPRCGVKDKIRHSDKRRRYTLEGSKWPLKELTYYISKYPSTLTDNIIIKNEIARAFKKKYSAMALYLITGIFWITCFAVVSYALPVADQDDAELYLKKFGYLPESDGAYTDRGTLLTAIRDFQRFFGLSETGVLDRATVALMNTPRCGVKDIIRDSSRKKRYVLQGSKWSEKELTYHISKYSSKFTDNTIVKNEMARAFKIWSDVTSLNFKENPSGQANIDIRFEVRDHGDGYAFDGPGHTLAHAAYPQDGGAAHFDDEETWTVNEIYGTNLLQVAAHEFGHSLGLSHSRNRQALMAPEYPGYIPGFQLHYDDIQGIQALYGPPGDAPNLCQDATIDAITRTQSGRTYVFKGDYYWEVLSNAIAAGYPRKISDDWGGLEGNLDAAVSATGKTYFFKGIYFWRFTEKNMDRGYPKLISWGFQGVIPDYLDAAFVWINDKVYFFKGDQYWRWDFYSNPPDSTGYPAHIRGWSSALVGGIDAAVKWDNDRTYFFKGDQYYRYNDDTSEVDEQYPVPTGREWFGC